MVEGSLYKFHRKPRFSANHLADYLCARSAPKRTSIIRAAKFPRRLPTVAYTQAKPAMVSFLAGNTGNLAHLDGPLDRLAAKARRESGYARDEALRCHAAIEAFKEAFKKARAKRYTFTPGPIDEPMFLEGVAVNVRLDVGLIEELDDGDARSGGCVLFLAGSADARRHIEDRRKYVAAIVNWTLEGGQMEPLPRLCMSFDVFGRHIQKAPDSFERLRENMRHSCREVANRWDDVEPPAGYDGPDWR